MLLSVISSVVVFNMSVKIETEIWKSRNCITNKSNLIFLSVKNKAYFNFNRLQNVLTIWDYSYEVKEIFAIVNEIKRLSNSSESSIVQEWEV